MTGRAPLDPDRDGFGYAYLVLNPRTGFFKIGSARNPSVRLKALCREMLAECLLLHTIATNAKLRLEKEIQHRFLDAHAGGEWFELDAEQVATVQSVCSVFYHKAACQARSTRRADFDAGAPWAKNLPICGGE